MSESTQVSVLLPAGIWRSLLSHLAVGGIDPREARIARAAIADALADQDPIPPGPGDPESSPDPTQSGRP